MKPKINPLSRIPRQQRLVMAIRGGAGVGKSVFAKSMADAGVGRLCIFDTERKSRLLKGVGVHFDALEIEQPDELPEFIDWALSGDGREQNYGCFALDSWAAYFGAKHSAMIQAVRERSGNPLAQPTAEELAADQMVLQGVLRRLCTESGKSVVIIDQIAARGKEAKEDNKVGRVLPMTASGLEYFVDVMVEVSLQERDGEIQRVFQVVKSNSSAFEVGFELIGDATFGDFMARLGADPGSELPSPAVVPVAAAVIEEVAVAVAVKEPMSLQDLLYRAEMMGFAQKDVVVAAKLYHDQPNITKLTVKQLEDLEARMKLKHEKLQSEPPAPKIRRPVTHPANQH